MGELINLDRTAGPGVATVVLDRPKVNAIDEAMLNELLVTCSDLQADSDIRAVVLTGAGKNFAAGADITAFPTFGAAEALAFSQKLNDVALALEALPQITIAAINGYALGGGLELALATDFRVMATNARIGLPEILLGIIPGGGGTQRLSRLAGMTVAKEMVYSGRNIEAPEAMDTGIVSSIHESETLLAEALELAAGYAAGPASLRIAKRVLHDGYGLAIADAVALEAQGFADTFATDDNRVGVQSFLDNGPGKATFTGR